MFNELLEQYKNDPTSDAFREDADIIADEFDPFDNAVDDAILPVADDVDLGDDGIVADPEDLVDDIDSEINATGGEVQDDLSFGADVDIDDDFEDEVKGALLDDDAFSDDDLTIFDTQPDDVGDVVDDVTDVSDGNPLSSLGIEFPDTPDLDD